MASLTYVSVGTHRAISSMKIIKPPWPEPEDSICDETRWECPGSGKSYWSARGPALQAFITVKDKIKQHLEDVEHQLYEGLEEASIPHAIGYFMVGSSAKKARPYIVISCQNERFSKRAMKAIKTTTWWRVFTLENLGFGGFRLLRYAPRRIADMQMVAQNNWIYTSDQYESLIGAPIFFTDDALNSSDTCNSQQATLGGIVYLDGVPFGLTVAHPLSAERLEETMEHNVQYNTNEFYADDSDDEFSVTSTSTSASSPALVAEPSVNAASSQRQPLPGKPRLVGQFVGRSTGTAYDPFDWALIAFGADAFGLLEPSMKEQSAASIRSDSQQIVLSFDDTTPMVLHRAWGESSHAVINADESLICLVGSRRYLSLHSLMTKESLRVGDCGTWILDHKGGWCGHIVASIPGTKVSYFAHATGIVSDIQEKTGMSLSIWSDPWSFRHALKRTKSRWREVAEEAAEEPCTSYLYAVSKLGYEKVVKLLLDVSADVKAYNRNRPHGNALIAASSNGHDKVVELLLNAGADVNARDKNGDTPLHAVSGHCYQSVAERLLRHPGTDLNAQNGIGDTPLRAASRNNNTIIVKLLLDAGADANVRGGRYNSVLQDASQHGREEIMKLLLKAGANVNIQGLDGSNALQAASKHGYKGIVKLLLDAGTDVNAQGGDYGSALQAASQHGREEIVKLLLKAGANVNIQGLDGSNALQAASKHGYKGIVKLLLDAGADVNVQGGSNVQRGLSFQSGTYGSALVVASRRGDNEKVKLLLDAGADVNARGLDGSNALQAASERGHNKTVELLVNAGAHNDDRKGSEYSNRYGIRAAKEGGELANVAIPRKPDGPLTGPAPKIGIKQKHPALERLSETELYDMKLTDMGWDEIDFLEEYWPDV